MPKRTMHITLLIHSKIAVFEWGKIIVDLFNAHTAKNKYTLSTVCDAYSITDFDSPIVIVGVDSVWLNGVFDLLNSRKSKTVLMLGMAHKNYEYVNHVSADQRITTAKCLDMLLNRGRTRTAFFGEQKNDTSDRLKSLTFSERFSPDDVYVAENDIGETFERLLSNINRYDSIVCANDVMAIYLISRFRALGTDIPKRLYLVGNGDLWLSAHVTPSLTTVSYNSEAMVKMAIRICEDLCEYDDFGSVNINVSARIIQRASTGAVQDETNDDKYPQHKRETYTEIYGERLCPELSEIVSLNRTLSACSDDQIKVLRYWINDVSVDRISDELFISRDTVKYHLKNLYKQLNVHSKNELMKLVNKYGLTL